MAASNITKGISIASVVAVLGIVGTGYGYDVSQRTAQHAEIETDIQQKMFAGNVELDLQSIELELKMYRTISERRELTRDETDRVEFLKSKRAILIAEQKRQIA